MGMDQQDAQRLSVLKEKISEYCQVPRSMGEVVTYTSQEGFKRLEKTQALTNLVTGGTIIKDSDKYVKPKVQN